MKKNITLSLNSCVGRAFCGYKTIDRERIRRIEKKLLDRAINHNIWKRGEKINCKNKIVKI